MNIELMLSPFDATIGGLRRAAAVADEAGVDGLWTMDHLTGTVHANRGTVLECLLALSVMAEATRRCRIGSLVLNPVSRQPVVLAQALAGLQELAEGRLVVGVGAGGGGGNYGVELKIFLVGTPILVVAILAARVFSYRESIPSAFRYLYSAAKQFALQPARWFEAS